MDKHLGELKCECCQRWVKCDPYNKGRQKYCGDCRKIKDKEKKSRYYNKRYRDDKAFQESERIRSREYSAACRKANSEPATTTIVASESPAPFDVMLFSCGMIAALIDSEDPAEVTAAVRQYESRGQRLASLLPTARAGPAKGRI